MLQEGFPVGAISTFPFRNQDVYGKRLRTGGYVLRDRRKRFHIQMTGEVAERTYFIRRPKQDIEFRTWVRIQMVDYRVRVRGGNGAEEVAGVEEARIEEADLRVRDFVGVVGGGHDATY